MDSPLGPTLAKVFFVTMKKFGFKIVLQNLNLLSIKGTFLLFWSKDHIEKFQNYLNHEH